MTRKKTVSRKRSAGRRREAEKATANIERLSKTAEQRAKEQWIPDPYSGNPVHQVKLIESHSDHHGVKIYRWRGRHNGGKRQSGFLVVGAGEITDDCHVLYRGPIQDRAWQVYRTEVGRVRNIIAAFFNAANEIAELGNDSQLVSKLRKMVKRGEWAEAARHLAGYSESFDDDDLDVYKQQDYRDMIAIDPFPHSEEYYQEVSDWERLDESDGDDDILHKDEDDYAD